MILIGVSKILSSYSFNLIVSDLVFKKDVLLKAFSLSPVGEKVAGGRMRGRQVFGQSFFDSSSGCVSTLTPALSLSREREFFVCILMKKAPGWAGAF